ncbi:MAG TPA: pyridoxamine 5'-phosphate oxidase family protein [Acidimicrobiales bacterium]|nr:pyridoxamine 5'-phosphate oxidase family protein [Acidimicrobiales bacterium]
MGWIDQRGSSVLPRNECLRLLTLHAGGVGRVGVATNGAPVIVPVNYRMMGSDVLVQVGRGTVLDAVEHHRAIAFEVDSELPPEAWSVYVRGPARRLECSAALAAPTPAGAAPSVPHPGTALVVIRSDVVSGRRFPVPPVGLEAGTPSRPLAAIGMRRPVCVRAGTTIRGAAAAMEAEQVSGVVLGDHPAWLVSEHDLVGGLAAGLSPDSPAADVATRAPLWATTTTTVQGAVALMAKHCLEHLLVITAEGELVGVLSRREALRLLVQERDQSPAGARTSEGVAPGV